MSTSSIRKLNYAYLARQFSHATKIYVSRGFRCSPQVTDKPNVAVNTRQNSVLVPNLRAVAIAKMAREYAYWSLTTAKVEILQYYSCWQSIPPAMPESNFLSTVTLEKQSIQITRRQFTFDDKNSTFDRENRVEMLTIHLAFSVIMHAFFSAELR